MDLNIMDIQAVESKLSDVTVTPIPRSKLQSFYNYQQQQQQQREQQPQIQISAIRSSSSNSHNNDVPRERDIYTKRERDYLQQSSITTNASAVAALQYSQLQAQLALLQQQANTTASLTNTSLNSLGNSGSIDLRSNNSNSHGSSNSTTVQSQLKYPQSTSPIVITTQTSGNITTPMTSTANLPSVTANGLSKYAQLLAVIEEMGRDIRPTYTGSRSSTEKLKRGIVHARILVRECLLETERSSMRQ